jgi:hypothetical protein
MDTLNIQVERLNYKLLLIEIASIIKGYEVTEEDVDLNTIAADVMDLKNERDALHAQLSLNINPRDIL